MTDRKASNHAPSPFFFIRMYCSMPFIPDDRKLLCCQDATAQIEGRSNISIFQFESHWNELVKKKKKGVKWKKSPSKQKRTNKVNSWIHPSGVFSLQERVASTVANSPKLGPVLQRQSFISRPPGIIRAPFHLRGRKRCMEGKSTRAGVVRWCGRNQERILDNEEH